VHVGEPVVEGDHDLGSFVADRKLVERLVQGHDPVGGEQVHLGGERGRVDVALVGRGAGHLVVDQHGEASRLPPQGHPGERALHPDALVGADSGGHRSAAPVEQPRVSEPDGLASHQAQAGGLIGDGAPHLGVGAAPDPQLRARQVVG
jgi:hypothetical protein